MSEMSDKLPSYKLPSYIECVAAVKSGEATALQQFIEANEPAGAFICMAVFREGLEAVIKEATE